MIIGYYLLLNIEIDEIDELFSQLSLFQSRTIPRFSLGKIKNILIKQDNRRWRQSHNWALRN